MPLLWDSPEQGLPLLSPISPSSPLNHQARRRRTCRSNGGMALAFIATAALSGAFVALVFLGFGSPAPDSFLFPLPLRRPQVVQEQIPAVGPPSSPPPPVVVVAPPPIHSDHLELDELRDLVGQTKGFLTRDYSLGLGWNNVNLSPSEFDAVTQSLYAGSIHHRGRCVTGPASQSHSHHPFLRVRTVV